MGQYYIYVYVYMFSMYSMHAERGGLEILHVYVHMNKYI